MPGVDIDWSILGHSPNIAQAYQEGADRGRMQSALGALGRDPNDAGALAKLYQVNPELGMRMEGVAHERAQWKQQQDVLAAQRTYYASRYGSPGGTPSTADALGSASLPTTVAGSIKPQGPTPAPTNLTTSDALASPNGGMQATPSPSMTSSPAPASSRMMSTPPGADQAWGRWAAVDPAGALKARQTETEWQSSRLKVTEESLKAHQAFNAAIGGLLNGVTDQASYDHARMAGEHLHDQYGFEMPDLPDRYDPTIVHALQMRNVEWKDAIAADLHEREFAWKKQNDQADNAREDRRTSIQDFSAHDASARGWHGEARADRADVRAARKDAAANGPGGTGTRSIGGKTYYQVGGRWFDNPEGR